MKTADLSISPEPVLEEAPSTNGVDAILAGDRKAFEEMVIQESPRLYRVILRVLGEPDEAQSILQETFLQAWQRLDTFRGDSRFTTWLYAIGINLAKGSLRKSRRLSSLDDQASRLSMGLAAARRGVPEVHAVVADEGLWIDVVSAGELQTARVAAS